jgi:hypothetical protein
MINGMTINATKPGVTLHRAQVLQLNEFLLFVALATRSTTNGFGAVAVINIAEVIGLADNSQS